MSVEIIVANSAGLLPSGSTAKLLSCAPIFGSFIACVAAAASRSTIYCGVRAGAVKPHQLVASNPEKPDSAIVGTSGASGERCTLATPTSQIAPLSACDNASPNKANVAGR